MGGRGRARTISSPPRGAYASDFATFPAGCSARSTCRRHPFRLAASGNAQQNRVRFAFWSGEEGGLVGSDYYVSQLSKKDIKNPTPPGDSPRPPRRFRDPARAMERGPPTCSSRVITC
ncbi:MAG: M28 family peptidase [Microbacteriaceae bacterium]